MRLSSRTEYALLALIYLARLKEGEFAHGQSISEAQGIPMSFLQQILFSLKQSRLVKSVKGRSGGYCLSKSASEISVAEVVRLFDGPLAPSRTVSKYFHEATPIAGEKKVTRLLRDIRDHVAKLLEGTSLADLI
jgi:Rrf2 family transcriptional regulator, cysteine metabolism repressor